jgi:hypothetical protein
MAASTQRSAAEVVSPREWESSERAKGPSNTSYGRQLRQPFGHKRLRENWSAKAKDIEKSQLQNYSRSNLTLASALDRSDSRKKETCTSSQTSRPAEAIGQRHPRRNTPRTERRQRMQRCERLNRRDSSPLLALLPRAVQPLLEECLHLCQYFTAAETKIRQLRSGSFGEAFNYSWSKTPPKQIASVDEARYVEQD